MLFLEEPSIEDRLNEVQVRRLHPVFFENELRDLLKDAGASDIGTNDYACLVSHERLRLALQDCQDKLADAAHKEDEQALIITSLQDEVSDLKDCLVEAKDDLVQARFALDALTKVSG